MRPFFPWVHSAPPRNAPESSFLYFVTEEVNRGVTGDDDVHHIFFMLLQIQLEHVLITIIANIMWVVEDQPLSNSCQSEKSQFIKGFKV